MLSLLPDAVVTTTTRPVTINVLANDAGDALTITSFSRPANGSLVFNADKSFTYTPAEGFVGDDGFSYTVRDGQGTPASIEVTISVLPDDDITAATDDIVEVVAAGDVIIPVLANDMVAGDGSLQISAVSVPGYGAVNVLPDQTIRYVPQRGFVGIDSFNYTVTDGQGSSASATVTVKVVASSSAPLAVSDTFTIEAGATTILAILSNDSDPDGGPLQVVGFTMPSHGELAFNPDKTFTYTPDAGYQGPDQFNYTIRDSQGASAAASVALDIVETAESAVALDDRFTTTAGAPVTVDVLANDILPAEQSIMIVAVTLPFKGRLTFNPDKTIIYIPNAGFVGTDDFTYTIGNGKGDTSKATVTVEVMPASSVDVYPNGYAYRRRIVLPAQSANETTVNDTVVLFAEKASWLKSVANGGKVVSPEGADLRFELTDGTKLDHEIELYDAEAGELLAWIRLPSWTLGEPLELSLFYGNPGQSTGEAQPTGVWRGYLARWRLPSGADATGQSRDLVPQGVADDSLLGIAARFDGNANLTLAEANWLNDLSALTVQTLIKPDAAMLGTTNGILVHGSPDSALWTNGLRLHYLAETSAGTPRVVNFSVRCTDGAAFTLSSGNQHAINRRLMHGTWQSGGAPQLYFDGIKDTPSRSEASAGTTLPISGPLFVGDGWQGLIDEVRIADRALPAEWIAVEARNMLDPKFSYGLGDEETSDTVDLSPIAVPFVVSTTSGKRVDIDVLAQAVDPGGAGGLLLTSVGQPLHGITTVVNNAVRYTPNAGFVGTDQFTYTISNGAKSRSGWIAVTVAAATESPSTPQTGTGVELPAAQRTVNVSNNSQLTSALSNAQPGDHIVLANGSYSSFNMTRSGAQSNPIVIRAANILGARFSSGYSINANDVICYGLSSSGYTPVGSAASAARTKFWRCRWTGGTSRFAIRLFNAPDFEGAYCEVSNWGTSGQLGSGFGFSIGHGAVRPVWRYSIFRDSTTDANNGGEAMHWSFGPPNARAEGLVYRCKFKNWNRPQEDELISCKSSGNIFRQISVENCGEQHVNNRFGGDNLYDAIWTRNSKGLMAFGGCPAQWGRNRFLNCRVDDNGRFYVRAGQEPPCTLITDGRNPASGGLHISGCTGPITVGATYSNAQHPADGTRIRQHSGSIALGGRLPGTSNPSHINTDSQPDVSETLYTWSSLIWLEDSDVGPFANL